MRGRSLLRGLWRPVTLLLAAVLLPHAAVAAPGSTAPEPPSKPGAITPGLSDPGNAALVDGKPLRDILNSKAYLDDLVRYLLAYETWTFHCPDAEPEQRLRTLMVTDPVILPGLDEAVSPQWLEVIRVRGCNRSYERLIYAVYSNGRPVFHARVSGTTKTEPVLQHNAVSALLERETARSHRQGCERADSARIVSAMLDEDFAGDGDRNWREVWTVFTCKGASRIPVLFKSSDEGGISYTFGDPL